MRVKCIRNELTSDEFKHYGLPEQDYYLEVDKIYNVYSLTNRRGFNVIDYYSDSGYLSFAPLILFEVIDNKVNPSWEIVFDTEDGDSIELGLKPIIENKYYWDDLIESEPRVSEHFQKLKCIFEAYSEIDDIMNFKSENV